MSHVILYFLFHQTLVVHRTLCKTYIKYKPKKKLNYERYTKIYWYYTNTITVLPHIPLLNYYQVDYYKCWFCMFHNVMEQIYWEV